MTKPTFAELFCQRHNLPPTEYHAAVLRRTLHFPTRWLRPVLQILAPRCFAPDHNFIASVGTITHLREFVFETDDFVHNVDNLRFARRFLRMRVSVGRMRDLVFETMDHASVRAATSDATARSSTAQRTPA